MSDNTPSQRGGGSSRARGAAAGGRGKVKGRGKGGGAPASAYSKAGISDGSAINRPGVFISCTKGKEAACLGELFTLFNSLADELYPDMGVSASLPASGPGLSHTPSKDTEADSLFSDNSSDITMEEIVVTGTIEGKGKEKMSFEEELAKELSELKAGKDIQRFYNIPMETACSAFIAFRPPLVPSKLIHHYMHRVKDTGISRLRHVSRLVPVDAVGPANVARMMEMSKPLLSPVFDDPSHSNLTWRIIYNARSQPKLTRQQVTEELPKLVPGHKVDLKRGDIAVMIEVFKSIMGISVLEDYDVLKRYNVQELVNQYNQARGGNKDEGRVAKVANVKLVPTAVAANAATKESVQIKEAISATGQLDVLRVEKILREVVDSDDTKPRKSPDLAPSNVKKPHAPSTLTVGQITTTPEQQSTTPPIRHSLPPRPSAQVVAAGNQPNSHMLKEKMDKTASEVTPDKRSTEKKVDEQGKQSIQGLQANQPLGQAVQPQPSQYSQHAQQNDRRPHGQQAQHGIPQLIQYQPQPPLHAQSQVHLVPIAPWLLPPQHPGYLQQPVSFAPHQPPPHGNYMSAMPHGHQYGQELAGSSSLPMGYPPGFPQHAMFQPGLTMSMPPPPPPVPFASRPGVTGIQAVSPLVVEDDEMGKTTKVKPAWKRGEPVKRDRRGRCWHCGADRGHAADEVVERDDMPPELGKRKVQQAHGDSREIKGTKKTRR